MGIMKSEDTQSIVVRGAREHNLRDISLVLPRNQLIVFTGVSGSGKSSLAFDTLYAEGQRRYVESLSSYARQFLGQLQKPDVDFLSGLSPTISIQQKSAGRNPRSTVGTITEIHDYLRVLFARIGLGHCPDCGKPITAQSKEQILAQILVLPKGTKFLVLAPLIRGQKGEYKDLFEDLQRKGFVRARADKKVFRLGEDIKLDRKIKHDIEVVIDRLKIDDDLRSRLAEAVEQALQQSKGSLIVAIEKEDGTYDDILLSSHYACLQCNKSVEPPSPQLFSFNSPHGMCMQCDGLGISYSFDPDLMVPDPSLSFYQGAIAILGKVPAMGRWRKHIYAGVVNTLGIDPKAAWKDLPKQHQDWLLFGSGDTHIVYEWKMRGGGVWKHGGIWEGVVPQLQVSFKKTAAGPRKYQLEKYMRVMKCSACHGQRLNPQARFVKIAGKSLVDLCSLPVSELAEWLDPINGVLAKKISPIHALIADEVLKELRGRIGFLLNLGLHYLSLERSAPTLSGGEAQRIRLAGQIGCGLVGVLYILDEPSIGLHPRDNERLIESLKRLRDFGNTVIVVEHDEDTMRAADFIVDFGPGPGIRGGEIVATGSYDEIVANKNSLTGKYLSGKITIDGPPNRRSGNSQVITVTGAKHHNLKNINAEFPLGKFICVTGASGSGKSSLVNDILRRGLSSLLNKSTTSDPDAESQEDSEEVVHASKMPPGEHDSIKGYQHIDKVINIDQTAIGRTPRSNPATYIKVFDEIRGLFAELPEAKIRGYQKGRFSFNRPGGRCEACEGNGSNRLEMDFLADVWVPCPVCEGRRFNRETLQVRFKEKNIQEVLEMDIQQAVVHFQNIPKIYNMLKTLHDVGLDYMKLGQPAPTLSGGEAQRIKLAKELCKRSTGKTLYLLDEPTTGLHFEDIRKLLQVLHGFVDAGNTVLVIEHNLDVIKTADWIIDLGPEGGKGGGEILFAGTPDDLQKCKTSHTGGALKQHLHPKSKGLKEGKSLPKKKGAQQPLKFIEVAGAQQHNLKNVNVSIPRDKMTVCSGPSGSGKSSLALDTIYAEGQRRYIESLSAYARQFLGQMQKPRVEHVTGLSPAIAIEQKNSSKSPRSTIGTITEIHDYLRILFCRLGEPHCPKCNIPVSTQTSDEIITKIESMQEGSKIYLMAPIERKGQDSFEDIFNEIRSAGYLRVRIDGKLYTLENIPEIDHRRKHNVEVVIDRLVIKSGMRTRICDAVESGLDLGKGMLHVAHVDDQFAEETWKIDKYSQHFSCTKCNRGFEPLNPHHFSFNSPLGWCPVCEGLGKQQGANPALLVRNPSLTLRNGALSAWPDLEANDGFLPFAQAIASAGGFNLDTPFDQLTPTQQRLVFHGANEDWIEATVPSSTKNNSKVLFQYKGLFPALEEASRVSAFYRAKLDSLVSDVACGTCRGSRLRDDASACKLHFGKGLPSLTIGELESSTLRLGLSYFKGLTLSASQKKIAGELVREIVGRLQLLVDVGLDYVTLDRSGPTLSGGESQRIRLASQVGSGLTGVLYVLDEPTIGLHPRDNQRLLKALQKLRDLGNTLIMVEHDREVISSADYLLDFGPGAGSMGGAITASGTPAQVLKSPASLTGQYLSGKKAIPVPTKRRLSSNKVGIYQPSGTLCIRGARQNNLKNIDVWIPLGALISVTGVSGSGKSSLINEVLYQTLARRLHRAKTPATAHDDILGLENVDKVINVDQDPLGNSPQSNPATYTGVFDHLRELFSKLPESKIRGYQPRRFSFNKPGGRCDACEGNGQKCIEMHFLPDVWLECDICKGKRYNPETLAVLYKGKSIADVLEMRISDALALFENQPKIKQILKTLDDVGLGYMALGQSAPTLSGGEAQRVKLAAELARPNTGKTIYILDEPTTGLHFDDVRKLLEVLHRLVDLGNTVVVVEHNLDVIKSSDWIIDLGPEAGPEGGLVVAQGTPEAIVTATWEKLNLSDMPIKPNGLSHTAIALMPVLKAGPKIERIPHDPLKELSAKEKTINIKDLGEDVKMPWEADGKNWHTINRITLDGKPCRWEGKALEFLDKLLQTKKALAPADWTERSVVEFTATGKPATWFCHALTGHEWLLRLVFRVPKNSFNEDELNSSLDIPTLNNTEGLEIYGNESRVRVGNLKKSPWQQITILVHRLSEIQNDEFKSFIDSATAAHLDHIKRLSLKPEDLMPWKLHGDKWHLGEKGFPIGKKLYWDRNILQDILDCAGKSGKNLEIQWDNRDCVTFRVKGVTHSWMMVKTKGNEFLEVRLSGPSGKVNLDMAKGIGFEQELIEHRNEMDVIVLKFRKPEDFTLPKLSEFFKEHLGHFIKMKSEN